MRIIDYAKFIMKALNTNLEIKFDRSKPDGTPRKIVDNTIALKYGWKIKTNLQNGLKKTYQDYLKIIQ